jgi:hypothetical protein
MYIGVYAPNSTFLGIPHCIILSLIGIKLIRNLLHGSVVVSRIITGKPTNLEERNQHTSNTEVGIPFPADYNSQPSA